MAAKSRVVEVCPECGEHWDRDTESPRCSDPRHAHQTFELHVHLTKVVLPGGAQIVAASFDPQAPYARDEIPDYGLYLDPRWAPPWPNNHVDWPDFGVPDEAAGLKDKLRSLLARSRAGQRVEIGCLGGHGRTGTALAILAVLDGIPADRAVAWVREHYCPEAVETAAQEAFVLDQR